MIGFYSYENWHHGYARVHRSDCHFCNRGNGLFGGGRTPNGEWHGPYASADLARSAVSSQVTDIQDCSFCATAQSRPLSVPGHGQSDSARRTTSHLSLGSMSGLLHWLLRITLRCLYFMP